MAIELRAVYGGIATNGDFMGSRKIKLCKTRIATVALDDNTKKRERAQCFDSLAASRLYANKIAYSLGDYSESMQNKNFHKKNVIVLTTAESWLGRVGLYTGF